MSNGEGQKSHGCFFYGCIVSVIILLLVAVAGFIGCRYAVNKLVMSYSEASPKALPKVAVSSADATQLQDKVKTFAEAIKAGKPTDALVLTEQEVNVLIASKPELAQFKDRVYVSIKDSQIKGQISMPLDQMGSTFTSLRGRYLNGEVGFKVSLENGVLIVTLDSLQVKGESVPDQFLKAWQRENLAKDIYRDPQVAEVMRRIERIDVGDGRISVTPRKPSGQ